MKSAKKYSERIFVFGSNIRGVHGAGSAKEALNNHGAKWGVGVGRTGNSYAIPTKDERIRTMPIEDIRPYVKDFIEYAKAHNECEFHVVAIGCGLAGYKPEQMAPLFIGSPDNVNLPAGWRDYE